MVAELSAALLPRLAAGPAALTRSTGRLARTLAFAIDALQREEPVPRDGLPKLDAAARACAAGIPHVHVVAPRDLGATAALLGVRVGTRVVDRGPSGAILAP